jgi:hypothetical protein
MSADILTLGMQMQSSESNSATQTERRNGGDRRQPSTFPPQFSSQRRRRNKGRRRTDSGAYVDIYDRRNWMLAIAVMGLSFLDAVLTVYQIERGSVREANPIMSMAIAWGGVYAFFSLKAVMTAFPLAIIILHKEWLLARYMARVCLWFYVAILIYHLFLVADLTGTVLIGSLPL